MDAMVFSGKGKPLQMEHREKPQPAENQILLDVHACGVCRTDLHVIEGDLDEPKLPLVIGHEIVGTVRELGGNVEGFVVGQRVGVPWLGNTCGECKFCKSGRENLCEKAKFTGYDIDGGYATQTVVDAKYCFPLPDGLSDLHVAPFLCAGLIGWRTLKMAGEAKKIGIYGFGAAAHIVIQVALHQNREIYAFTRDGNTAGQEYARSLGAKWAGGSSELPPQSLDAALIFAPAGELIPLALKACERGGVVVCGGIHMSQIPSFSYDDLWQERSIKSVANLTRADAREFLELAFKIPLQTNVKEYKLADANQALSDLKQGKFHGAAVLSM